MSLRPVPLGAPLDPPAAVWRIGWGKNHTIQTSDLDPDVTEDRQQVLGQEWRLEAWTGPSIISAFRKPSQPDLVPTALTAAADALGVAEQIGDLWGVRRRAYDMEVLLDHAFAREIGEVATVQYPMDDLDGGRAVLIVGDAIRATEATARLRILV